MTAVKTSGVITIVGRFYRASDGSTREESGLPNGSINVISINNVSTSTHYAYVRSEWHRYPMKLPINGYHPGLRAVGKTNGLEESIEVIEGFQLYRLTGREGSVRYQAPGLNFFALRIESQDIHQEYSNVVIREQPREFFEPPDAAVVTPHDELRGIIASPTNRELEHRH